MIILKFIYYKMYYAYLRKGDAPELSCFFYFLYIEACFMSIFPYYLPKSLSSFYLSNLNEFFIFLVIMFVFLNILFIKIQNPETLKERFKNTKADKVVKIWMLILFPGLTFVALPLVLLKLFS